MLRSTWLTKAQGRGLAVSMVWAAPITKPSAAARRFRYWERTTERLEHGEQLDCCSVAWGHDRHASRFRGPGRSEEHTSELQSLMRISYAVFCLKKKKKHH